MKELEYCRVLGTNINVISMQETIDYITTNLEELRGRYICVSNVHTTVMAHDNEDYKNIQNSAAMALPDGKPLSVVSKKRGYANAQRVTGPDLMGELFAFRKEKPLKHYFYGATQETLDTLKAKLKEKYPDIRIVGMESPPFRPLSEEEDRDAVNRMNQAQPDIVWVGLGAPKQENWMYAHKDKVNAVMIGVGAGFDYHAGTIKRAPKWMQKCSLEWFYRLMQDPKRLFKRYFVTNFKFIYLILMENISGKDHKK